MELKPSSRSARTDLSNASVGGVRLKCSDMQKADAFIVEGSLCVTKHWEKP
jgi:hypothetical protein